MTGVKVVVVVVVVVGRDEGGRGRKRLEEKGEGVSEIDQKGIMINSSRSRIGRRRRRRNAILTRSCNTKTWQPLGPSRSSKSSLPTTTIPICSCLTTTTDSGGGGGDGGRGVVGSRWGSLRRCCCERSY